VSDRYPLSPVVPRGWGIALPFIGQGESDLQACHTILLRVEAWRTVPGSLRPSWRILFSRGVVACPVPEQERLRGWWCSGWLVRPSSADQLERVFHGGPMRYSGGHGDVLSPCAPTASGVSLQYEAWRCSDGDGRTGLIATGMAAPDDPTSWSSPV
jgi:hypothetical protein